MRPRIAPGVLLSMSVPIRDFNGQGEQATCRVLEHVILTSARKLTSKIGTMTNSSTVPPPRDFGSERARAQMFACRRSATTTRALGRSAGIARRLARRHGRLDSCSPCRRSRTIQSGGSEESERWAAPPLSYLGVAGPIAIRRNNRGLGGTGAYHARAATCDQPAASGSPRGDHPRTGRATKGA